jgi:hypothetical protein
MTTTDWIIDLALIFVVLRQLREERFTARFVLLPAGIVYYVVSHYLHALPTSGNDLVLIGGCIALGALLGAAGGLTTLVRGSNGEAYVRAGRTAATIWIASMTARLGFIIFITHSVGESWLMHFSAAHGITSADAWQDGLVLLALSEVSVRIGLIVLRSLNAKNASATTTTPAKTLAHA